MGLFNRETREEKAERLAHERAVDKAFLKAKREEELEAAKRNGKEAGAKGKRTFMDRLKDMGEAASASMKIMEEAIGEAPKIGYEEATQPKKRTKRSKSSKLTVIVVNGPEKETKKKTLLEEMWEI